MKRGVIQPWTQAEDATVLRVFPSKGIVGVRRMLKYRGLDEIEYRYYQLRRLQLQQGEQPRADLLSGDITEQQAQKQFREADERYHAALRDRQVALDILNRVRLVGNVKAVATRRVS